MAAELLTLLECLAGLTVGGIIGVGFGKIQEAARLRNEKLQLEQKLNSGWAVMPGSGVRVAYLLVTLALVQVICPLLFTGGVQWCVSAGLAGGYGWMLWRQLRERRARNV